VQRGSGIEVRQHILSPDGLIAVQSQVGTQTKLEFHHHDHLGSVDTLTNASGQVLQRYAYDAFGARRGAGWSPDYASFNFLSRFGFTGHAMIDAVGLIHMNGRVFDPKLARFISADPFIQFPHHTQAHNRYSYLLNNPLNATDPTGFFLKKLGRWVKKNFRTLVAVAITAVAPYASAAFGIWGAMATGFAAGLVGSGGDLKAGLIGALAAGAFYGISQTPLGKAQFGTLAHGGKIVAHGFTGGIAAKASGGEFRHGFLSAGASAFASPLIESAQSSGGRIIAASVVGGTASELGGGKFGNGASTAAFLMSTVEAARYYESRVGERADLSPGDRRYRNSEGKCCAYEPADSNGRAPGTNYNVIGLNNPLEGSFWGDFGSQGGPLSRALNLVPGINATAHLHDWWFNSGTLTFNVATNIGSMLPAVAIAYAAGAGQYLQGWHHNPTAWQHISQPDEQRGRR
jgi:RHS repeat-associated protein